VVHFKIIVMNKADLIDRIAAENAFSKKQACAMLNSLTNILTNALESSGRINLFGLGIFKVSRRASRRGRNPRTGATIRIKEKKMVRFKVSGELSDHLNST
jgi:DNA-binding protein HU-beta